MLKNNYEHEDFEKIRNLYRNKVYENTNNKKPVKRSISEFSL